MQQILKIQISEPQETADLGTAEYGVVYAYMIVDSSKDLSRGDLAGLKERVKSLRELKASK